MQELIVDCDSKRLDSYLASRIDVSRSKITKMIKNGNILLNDFKCKASDSINVGDRISYEIIDEECLVEPENIPLDIVYEDDDVIVVNKPNGMVVHPAVGNKTGTLVNALMYHSKNLSSINGEFRPGIVHRIDAYTTGLLMVAKNDYAHEFLQKQLQDKTTTRKYVALVWGVIPNDTGVIDAPIMRNKSDRKKMAVGSTNSKDAITHFKVLERFKDATLIELKLETGRTHQIRVHLSYIGHPVVNDPVYGRRKLINDTGQCLHAKTLGFIHPTTKKYMEFDSELPECFTNILDRFRG